MYLQGAMPTACPIFQMFRTMDKDNDQKLNLLEFETGAYNNYKTYLEYESANMEIPTSADVFDKLDVDQDK